MVSRQYILLILLLCNDCESGKILAIIPTPAISHQIVFQPLWKSLLMKGHQITLLTTDPITDANLRNFKQIDWSFANELWHSERNLSSLNTNFRQNKLTSFNRFVDIMHDIVIQELEHNDVQELINNKTEHFDLAIIEYLHPTMLAFSERFRCPYIGVSSIDATTIGHEMVGNPTNPAIYSDFLVPYDSKMTFFERILNTLNYIGISLYFHCYLFPREDSTVRKYFGEGMSRLRDIQKNASMVFLNTHPVLHDTRPLMPKVLQIGGAIHLRKLNTLPQDLELFLNGSEHGVIYFSLGSNVKLSDLSYETIDIFLETFAKSPFRIVWRMEENALKLNRSNVFVGNWLPQQEILAHKNVKLFVTSGEQQSLEEAIYYSVPIIGMPYFADQWSNIRRLSKKGVCLQLDVENLGREDLENAIIEVTTNERYLNSMKELSTLLKEQPVSSLEQAVWWTEYVIRHKGAKILRSEVPDMPLHQYLLLDVIGVFLLVFILCLFIQYKFLKWSIKRIRYKMREHKFYKLE